MFRKKLSTLVAAALLSAANMSYAATVLVDGFESGNLTAPNGPSPAVNKNGFRWDLPNRTSVVRTSCKGGAYCLQFIYYAGYVMSEQRFNMGAAYKDVWVRYWLRVPPNYTHDAPYSVRKFFALWMDDYSGFGNGPTVFWTLWGNGSGGSNLAVHYSVGGHTGSGPTLQVKPFIANADRGKWMEVMMHVKAATTINSNDGVIQLWRRWDGQSSFTKIHELTNADIGVPSTGPQGWNKGYFMGETNVRYAANTIWLLDNLTIFPTLSSGAAANGALSAPVPEVQ